MNKYIEIYMFYNMYVYMTSLDVFVGPLGLT